MTVAPFKSPIYVTRPIAPPLAAYARVLEGAWAQRRFTNGGELHAALEAALGQYLGARHLSLTGNGTLALSIAARALDFTGEVVTTPFTFPATPEILTWAGVQPVFADISPTRLTLDPEAVERAITPRTSGILAVHVYGVPCDVYGLQKVAERHGLKLLYDGAHAFGSTIDGRQAHEFGDATALSFHATKLFHTAEGGALVSRDGALKSRFDLLRNFGIVDEVQVLEPGINGKMSELQAGLGLLVLRKVDAERRRRRLIADAYRSGLNGIDGLECVNPPLGVVASDQYFVIRVDGDRAAIDRDALCERLKAFNVFCRRYFYPLCSALPFYRDMPSSRKANLPVAERVSKEVLCLPFYGDLSPRGAERICAMIRDIMGAASAP